MSTALTVKLPEFLEDTGGEVRITGHRITLYHVLKEYNAGESPEGIALKLPTLKTSTVHRIVAFYLDNQLSLDTYFREYTASLVAQETSASPAVSKADLLRRLEDIRLKAHHASQVSY